MFRIYGYLRASTDEQDALRAKEALEQFVSATGDNLKVAHWFIENESGAKLQRPELFRLLDIAVAGDVLLVEQIDRLSRLTKADWEKLKKIIADKRVRIVSLDLPSSYIMMKDTDDFTDRIITAINDMLLDFLAAFARKDYEDRRRRQAEGISRAKEQGKYKGRGEDVKLHGQIEELLEKGSSYSFIMSLLSCSSHTISKVNKRRKAKKKA